MPASALAGDAVQIEIKAKDDVADFRMRIAVKVIRVIPAQSIALQFEAMRHRDLRILRALLRRPLQAALGSRGTRRRR